jgi:hypothetical protein
MNLARHASVLWRFRRVTLAGVFLGIVLAVLASYSVSSKGLSPRGVETWSATSQILVTQPGFPEGRVTLPEKQIEEGVTPDGEPAVDEGAAPSEQLEFADPARLSGLGDLYSKFLTSDKVLSRVPGHPAAAQVQASPFASSQGGLLLPVVQLTTMGPSAAEAQELNLNTYKSLLDFLDDNAKANDIVKAKRVQLELLVSPEMMLVSGRKPTASVLIFMLVLLGTVAVTHLLEALRNRRRSEELAGIVDWHPPAPMLDDEVEPFANGDRLGSEPLSRRS